MFELITDGGTTDDLITNGRHRNEMWKRSNLWKLGRCSPMQELQWMMNTLRWLNISNISAHWNQLMAIVANTPYPEMEWPRKEWNKQRAENETSTLGGVDCWYGGQGQFSPMGQKAGLWQKLTRKGSNQQNCGSIVGSQLDWIPNRRKYPHRD